MTENRIAVYEKLTNKNCNECSNKFDCIELKMFIGSNMCSLAVQELMRCENEH